MYQMLSSLSSLPGLGWLFAKRLSDRKPQKGSFESALIFDPKTQRYKLRQDIFDKAIADAAAAVWSRENAKTNPS